MRLRILEQDCTSVASDALIVPLLEDQMPIEGVAEVLDKKLDGLIAELRANREWRGEHGETVVLYRPRGLKTGRLVLVGLGARADADYGTVRTSVLRAVRRLRGCQLRSLVICPPDWLSTQRSVQAVVEGVVLAGFDPGGYKTESRATTCIEEVLIGAPREVDPETLEGCILRGSILSEAANLARSLTNEPGNRADPAAFAERAVTVAEKCGLDIDVLDEPEIRERGMNAILAVAAGSVHPPRFIVLRHYGSPHSCEKPIAFVGKGVTFDSGGLSLKPAQSMEEMKTDKAGACSVLGAMRAIAQLQVPKNVVALLPMVENLPGGRAQRPGDVIHSLSGKSIEVVNTDAEGRLLLADALAYARKQFDPACMIDVATLTGACVVALGHVRAGLFSNDERLCERVLHAAKEGGEKLWRLPLDPRTRKEIESSIADVRNVGNRWGGAVTAAKFLQEFVGDTPWCHIDMAGADLFHEKRDLEGPTGFGVRTLTEFTLHGLS